MNTQPLTNSAVDPAFAAWAAQIRALRAEHARPIEDESDPRFAALADEITLVDGHMQPDYLGERYFEHVSPSLWPACPIPAPAWGEERDVTPAFNDWPLIQIADASGLIEVGSFAARIMRYATVVVDELPADWNVDPDGIEQPGERPVFGEVTTQEMVVEVYNFETRNHAVIDLTIEQVPQLVETLQRLLKIAEQ